MRRAAGGPVSMLAVVLTASVLAGCGGGSGSADPSSTATASTGDDTRHRAQCTPSDAEGEIILQPGSLTADRDLRLDRAELDSAVNLEIIEQDVVRFTGRSTISGFIRDYPPLKTAGLADSLADWDERRPLEGLRLVPDDEQQAVLVAVRLTDPGKAGHLDGVTLTTDEGQTSFAQPVLVNPPGAVCTVEDYESTLDWVP